MYFCWQNDVSAFNTLSRFVIAFLQKSKSLNFMATVTIQSSFVSQENKTSHCYHFFPFIYHEVLGPDAMTLVYWMLSFKPAFSLSSFTLIKRLFGSSLHYAIRVLSTVYLSIICISWAPTVCQILAWVQPCYTHWLFAPLWTPGCKSCMVMSGDWSLKGLIHIRNNLDSNIPDLKSWLGKSDNPASLPPSDLVDMKIGLWGPAVCRPAGDCCKETGFWDPILLANAGLNRALWATCVFTFTVLKSLGESWGVGFSYGVDYRALFLWDHVLTDFQRKMVGKYCPECPQRPSAAIKYLWSGNSRDLVAPCA